jgi:hypothetical protein
MNSVKPVNVYVILCDGTIDAKLESLTDEKTDAAELVLDGRLIGERPDEVNLAELLKIAQEEFANMASAASTTIDEALLQKQWPNLRAQLETAMAAWDEGLKAAPVALPPSRSRSGRARSPVRAVQTSAPLDPVSSIFSAALSSVSTPTEAPAAKGAPAAASLAPTASSFADYAAWRAALDERANLFARPSADLWSSL